MNKNIDHEQQYLQPKMSPVPRVQRYSFLLLLTGLLVVAFTPAAQARHLRLKPGDILVADREANPQSIGGPCQGQEHCLGVLWRVDPATGQRDIVADFNDIKQGRLGATPLGVAVEATGTILVTDANAGEDSRGALFRVDPVTRWTEMHLTFTLDKRHDPGSTQQPEAVARVLGHAPLVIAYQHLFL